MTAPLPLPDDPLLDSLTVAWQWYAVTYQWPRSRWLHDFEAILRKHFPQASSDQLTLTARLAAPFPLAKPGVP